MITIKQYALRIILTALISGVLLSIVKHEPYSAFLRFLSGIQLTMLLLIPLREILCLPEYNPLQHCIQEGIELSEIGNELATREKSRIITDQVESYILDIASQHQWNLEVNVTLGSDDQPEKVEITGQLTQPEKQKFSEILEKELGIAKENLLWTGQR